jgi:oligosaccharide translocation protein RFT1
MPPSFATSASLLIALQLGSRLFTFGLNQALLRFVSPQAFGTAAIQFELLSSTILFLSREGFRNALLRAWSETRPKEGQSVPSDVSNLAILPSIIGLPVSLITSWLYYQSCSAETKNQSHFSLAVLIYGLASCIELASEPYYVRYVDYRKFHSPSR